MVLVVPLITFTRSQLYLDDLQDPRVIAGYVMVFRFTHEVRMATLTTLLLLRVEALVDGAACHKSTTLGRIRG